jgi:hypothetical protein
MTTLAPLGELDRRLPPKIATVIGAMLRILFPPCPLVDMKRPPACHGLGHGFTLNSCMTPEAEIDPRVYADPWDRLPGTNANAFCTSSRVGCVSSKHFEPTRATRRNALIHLCGKLHGYHGRNRPIA